MTGTISDIQPVPRDPELRRVRVAGRIAAHLPATEVQAIGLHVGQAWTEALDAQVRAAVARHAARRDALRLLERRAYAAAEIVARLTRRGHEVDTAHRIVEELAAGGWIDDRAYARAYATELLGRQPAGRDVIVERLRRRQVPEGLARETADAMLTERPVLDGALEYAGKRLRSMKAIAPAVAARRIANSLARRGIDPDTIQTVLHRLDLPGSDDFGS